MITGTKNSRLHRLRKLGYTPLVVAVAAGTICTAAGTSTADADADAAITSQSGAAYNWTLTNRTGQPIYGTWSAEMSTGDKSHVEAPENDPWKLDDTAEATQYQSKLRYTTWKGHICYNKRWWNFVRSDRGFGYGLFSDVIPAFSLEVDSAGTPFVYPDSDDRFNRYRLIPQASDC